MAVGGVSAWEWCLPGRVFACVSDFVGGTPSSMNRITDRCKKHYLQATGSLIEPNSYLNNLSNSLNSLNFNSIFHICLVGAVVASWSLTQEVAGSRPFTVMTIFFITEFSESRETFRKNSIVLKYLSEIWNLALILCLNSEVATIPHL